MFKAITKKLFGTENERFLKSLNPIVEEINKLEKSFCSLMSAISYSLSIN